MAELLNDLLDAFLTSDPGARQALRTTRPLGEAQAAQDLQILAHERRFRALETQVAALQHTVATLADALSRAGTIGDADRNRIVRAARRDGRRVEPKISESALDEADTQSSPAIAMTPHRGVGMADGRGCASCGKALAKDDPELRLSSGGRVCPACFTPAG